MAEGLRRFRRGVTEWAVRKAIATTAALSVDAQRSAGRSLARTVGAIPMLRQRVRENMRLALGQDIAPQTARMHFRHLGWLFGNALATFHNGIGNTPVPDEIVFDPSVRVLDEAVAEGRGVVLTAPHWIGHELVAAAINRRHPLAMLVREASDPGRMERKLKWYTALGAEVVLRPNRPSTMRDVLAYANVLRRGRLLAITPDLLTDPDQGIETRLFGRTAHLHGGAFALAIAGRAPMVRVSGLGTDSGIVVRFDRAPFDVAAADRTAAVRAGVQDWCRWFEGELKARPENWLFWLDRRWSRFLRATPRTTDPT